MAPDHLGGVEFDLQLLWSAQTFDSPYQLWRATSSYSRSEVNEWLQAIETVINRSSCNRVWEVLLIKLLKKSSSTFPLHSHRPCGRLCGPGS